jgi:hypothetical protein
MILQQFSEESASSSRNSEMKTKRIRDVLYFQFRSRFASRLCGNGSYADIIMTTNI